MPHTNTDLNKLRSHFTPLIDPVTNKVTVHIEQVYALITEPTQRFVNGKCESLDEFLTRSHDLISELNMTITDANFISAGVAKCLVNNTSADEDHYHKDFHDYADVMFKLTLGHFQSEYDAQRPTLH